MSMEDEELNPGTAQPEPNAEPAAEFDKVRYLEPEEWNPVRVETDDGIIGSLLWHDGGCGLELVEDMMKDAPVWEDPDGEICAAIMLPGRCLRLPEDRSGVVVYSNLSANTKGIFWMLDPAARHMAYDDGFAVVCRCLSQYASALDVLASAGNCYFTRWDGHQLFFNLDYGMTRLILDGDGMERVLPPDADVPAQRTGDALSAMLLYAFTGAWPDRDDLPEGLPTGYQWLTFTAGCPDPDGPEELLERWETLPGWLRDKFVEVNTGTAPGGCSAREWAVLLRDAADEMARCPHCGAQYLADARRCLHCGRTVDKRDLQVRFRVTSDQQPVSFTISFPRGTVFDGTNLSRALPAGALMRLVYNGQKNILGLRNLSNTPWRAVTPEGDQQIAPNGILEIREDLQIQLDSAGSVRLEFLGYES